MSLVWTASRLDRPGLAPYAASLSTSFAPVLDLWTRMADEGAALPFQRRAWLEPWRETIGCRDDLDLLAVTIRDADGTPVAGLPLVRERRRLRRIGFADGGLADYNAPILTPGAPPDAAGAASFWRALLGVLPRADLIRFERMPTHVGGLVNPLAILPAARPATAGGLVLAMPGTFEAWRRALPRRYRMELGRCARLFDALPGASFERVTHQGEAVFAALERLQRDRIGTLGLPYTLDDPAEKTFYRTIAADLSGGPGVLTALVAEGEVVAALFGLRDGKSFVMLRIGAAAAYSRMSPARDLIVRTMEGLAREGVSSFDFGLGDYAYKRKLGGEPRDLVDLVAARSPLGLLQMADFRLRAQVRTMPRLHTAAKRLRATLRVGGSEAPPPV